MRLLLLEDNVRLGELTRDHLRDSGFTVDIAHSLEDFACLAARSHHSVYIVDLGLPDGDAVDLIRALRVERRTTPILITSARSHVEDRIHGLEAGADDYLVKPFNHHELIARIRALLRRPELVHPCRLTIGALQLETASGEIFFEGRRLELRLSERRLLALLMSRSGRVVSKAQIEEMLYDLDAPTTANAIEQLVSRLRKRINTQMGVAVTTVRGEGYLLEVLT